jgi:exodeoxyribonuclease VII large subunit
MESMPLPRGATATKVFPISSPDIGFEGGALWQDKVVSVRDLSVAIKRQIEGNFSSVKVRGEIFGLKKHSSGHIYFSLKDSIEDTGFASNSTVADAVINAICWRGTVTGAALEDGLEIIATGRVTTYPGRSNYQIIVSEAEAAGHGALLKLLDERKQKFAAEGLFSKKRALPAFPKKIGVITSPTGAVIQDIIHRITDRYPCHLLIWPVAVQGNTAAEQIAAAIAGFNELADRPDVLIVARGGGSLEDLWAFNEECVVRAAFNSEIPLISAIGHETDTTLLDYAADARAPTPTAAAEIATPVLSQVVANIRSLGTRLAFSLRRVADNMSLKLQRHRLPMYVLNGKEMRLDDYAERLLVAVRRYMADKETRLVHYIVRSPRGVVGQKEARLWDFTNRFLMAINRYKAEQEARCARCAIRPPTGVINKALIKLPFLWEKSERAMKMKIRDSQAAILNLSNCLSQNSYEAILKKGFCLVMDEKKSIISSANNFRHEQPQVSMVFHDGRVFVLGGSFAVRD